MKKKGISLIVLIITIVVIIILAASIILNLTNTNIIGNANTAVLKSDIATLQSELDLYVSDRFVDEKGKYDSKKLNADQATAMYGTENVEDENSDGSVNIYDILTSLEKSKYKNNVYIQEGKLVFKNSGLKDEEVEVILGLGYEVDGMPKVTSISTESALTSIEVTLNVTLAEEVEKYIYILNDGQREESTELTKTYTGLTPGVNYTLEVILVLKDGTEISKKEIISTKNIDGEITYVLSETNWTKNDVTVTLEYSEETLPEGYVLQYRTKDVDGNTIQDWTAYTAPVVVTTNNTSVVGRLYNETLSDEKVPSDTKVQNIDKDVPAIPTLTLTATKDTVTAVASGSEDVGSGIDKYMYSMDNTTWQESNKFTGLIPGTEYTLYAKAMDNVGNESEVIEEKVTIELTFSQVDVGIIVTGDNNATINGNKATYNNPVIPVGFKAKETTDATWSDTNNDGSPDGWNNGLVVQDENENEFVWVPVDGTNVTYAKWCTTGISYSSTSDDTAALPIVNGTSINENIQITKYGGFYIGRYEAGVPANQTAITGTNSSSNTTGIPVVKKDAKVWGKVSYTNANKNALGFCDKDNVKSGLLTGTAWDTVCSWIQSETDSNGDIIHSVTNSESWGNYSNTTGNAQYGTDGTTKISGTIRTAGYSEYWKAKNVYDIAGNTWAWTGEIHSSGSRVRRGGDYDFGGAVYPASFRFSDSPSNTDQRISFRIMLYVM